MATTFPEQAPGVLYLTEGGSETEIMYKHGFELPEFSMYPLLDDPAAMEQLRRAGTTATSRLPSDTASVY